MIGAFVRGGDSSGKSRSRSRARASLAGGLALAAGLAILAAPERAVAQDLVPDRAPATDPNGPPPPPPPMPPPGTPGSVAPPPPPGSTAAQLDQATREDTGVGLHFVYLQPEIGLGYAKLGKVLPADYDSAVGPVLGVGVGAELITFQLGARLRAMPTKNWNLWSVGGELNYQPGSGRFWPRVGVALGYVWANGLKDFCGAACGLVSVSGIDIGGRAGVQYFVTPQVEIGADAGLDLLFLHRSGSVGAGSALLADESSTGVAASAVVHVGWHF